jgi:hypothetical protein
MRRMGMSRVSFALVVLAGALLAGCDASGRLAPEAAQLDAKSYVVPAGQSSIYFYRTRARIEAGLLSKVYLDGELITVVGPGNFVRMDVEPGKHAILSESGTGRRVTTVIDASANRNHFIKMSIVPGWFYNPIKQKIVSEERGIEDLKSFKLVETL